MTGLTTRGRAVLAGGATLILLAWLLGQRDLLRVGVLALALPLVCAALVVRTRYRLTCARGIGAPRISVGAHTTTLVRLQNSSRLPSGLLLVEDMVPPALGDPCRATVDRLEPGGRRDLTNELEGVARGRYQVGPVTLSLRDPFGLCEVRRAFSATDTLVVTPRTITLPPNGLAGLWGGRGDSESRSIAHTGDDDVIPRTYRTGDDLRRVHWRATARSGELMVRREEQPWRTTATIVLDRRPGTHRGVFPDTTFEVAVSVAASAAVHLARLGLQVRVLDTSGLTLASTEADGDNEGLLLDALALVVPARAHDLTDSAPLRRALADGTLLAVVSDISPADAEVLAGLRGAGGTAAALVVDPAGWGSDDAASQAAATSTSTFARHGWRAASVHPDRSSNDPDRRAADLDQGVVAAWAALATPMAAGARG